MGWTASDFERLDPRLFRSFLAVVKTQSFSAAATEASLTQGAISQQIAKLEERLNTQLFVRACNRVVLTTAGQMLATYALAYMDHATRFLEQLNEEFESMHGMVRYAMPESCIHAPHFSWLLEKRKSHPNIVLDIKIKPASEVVRDVLDGDIDFGFVNQQVQMPAVQSYPFCFEEYALVQSCEGPAILFPRTIDEVLELPMVLYPDMPVYLNHWLAACFCGAEPISVVALQVRGEFNDMRGALAMVEGDLGLTVMPRHVAAPAVAAGRLREICPSTGADRSVAKQQVWIIRLKERRMPARVKRVIRWFLEMHTELQTIPAEFMK